VGLEVRNIFQISDNTFLTQQAQLQEFIPTQVEVLDAATLGLINKPTQVQAVDELEFTMAMV